VKNQEHNTVRPMRMNLNHSLDILEQNRRKKSHLITVKDPGKANKARKEAELLPPPLSNN
jgi:hypothetical protein